MISPAARTAAYLLAEALLLLLRALLAHAPAGHDEAAAELRRVLEDLTAKLRHVATTGEIAADAAGPVALVAAPVEPRPAAARRRRAIPTAHPRAPRAHRVSRTAPSLAIREPIAPRAAASTHD